jgi:pimeloyl-ACP methyl ester carboxylesterase
MRALVLFGFCLVGCTHLVTRNPAQVATTATNLEWEKYMASLPAAEIQPDCMPRRYDPPADTEQKGSLFLVHGYTACPQQFFEMSELFAKRGWTVYLVLMPGQGRLHPAPHKDDYSKLPKTTKEYTEFSELINRIARAENKLVSIGGLSVGGAVAARAALLAPDLYKRLILYSPFFQISGTFERTVVGTINLMPHAKHFEHGWGEGCFNEVERGRAGICTFEWAQLSTVDDFGTETIRLAQSSPLLKTEVQFAGVEADKAASNSASVDFLRAIMANPHVNYCVIRAPADHSTISRFDNPDEDKFWLPTLLHNSIEFIDGGTPFAASEFSYTDPFIPRCSIDPNP